MQKNENKKIALLMPSFRAGGGEKAMIQIAGGLVESGCAVDLIVMRNDGELRSIVSDRVNIINFNTRRMIFSLPLLVLYLVKTRPLSIMALDEYSHLIAICASYLTLHKTKVVLRIGNMYTELFERYRHWKDKLLPFFIRLTYRFADHVVAVSRGVADDITKIAGLDHKKITVIYNPKPQSEIVQKMSEPATHPWLEQKTLPVAIAVGRLREQKNLGLLIRAFSKIQKRFPSRLIIIGAGRDEGKLRRLISDLNAEDYISLPGFMENPYSFMARSDLFVFPSLWEGMPNAVIEALMCGLPIIASDCDSGPREILAPKTPYNKRIKSGYELGEFGVLVAVNDEDSFVEAVVKMFNDKKMQDTYRERTMVRASDFDIDKHFGPYEEVLGLFKVKKN